MRGTVELNGVFLLFASLTCYRVTRLIVKDSLFNRPRSMLLMHLPSKLKEGLVCPFCQSAYVAGAIIGLTYLVRDGVALPFMQWFAIWSAAIVIYFLVELMHNVAEHFAP